MSYFLMEQSILQEAEVESVKNGKAIFRLALQDADVPNRNKRLYPKKVLMEGINNCMDKIKNRSFLGELDHPIPTGRFDEVRQTTVLLSEVSHLVRDTEWRGNVLWGELETLDTPKGRIAYNLIKDRIGIGTSMRGMGELDRTRDYNIVKGPLIIICYDLVTSPSHKISRIDEHQVRFESIQESANLICVDGQCYLPNYFDKLVENKMIKFFKRWV